MNNDLIKGEKRVIFLGLDEKAVILTTSLENIKTINRADDGVYIEHVTNDDVVIKTYIPMHLVIRYDEA